MPQFAAPERVLPPTTRRPLRTALAAVATVALSLGGLIVGSVPASAAPIDGAITSVTLDKVSYDYYERVELSFEWAVPDTAEAGDTFGLTLPAPLNAASTASFQLVDSANEVVATGVWTGKTVLFELTDYVNTHDEVSGSGFFATEWDHSFITDTTKPVTLVFEGLATIVVDIGEKPLPGEFPTERGGWKGGWWRESAEGTTDPVKALSWGIALPANSTGFAGPITIVDTVGAGSQIDCASIKIDAQVGDQGKVVGKYDIPFGAPTDRAQVTCTTTGFTVVLDRIAPNEFVTIYYSSTITDQSLGAYSNKATVDIPGQAIKVWDHVTERSSAGGVGGGKQRVSVGDYVWLDSNRDGRQDAAEKGIPGVVLVLTGPNGTVTDVAGKAVAPQTTNAAGGYSFVNLPVLPAGQHYTVTIDREASKVALEGLFPTKSGQGDDRAIDSSTWVAVSTDLATNGAHDPTLDFGFVTFELPTLPLPEDPKTPALASTGLDTVVTTAIATFVLFTVGGLLLLVRRRARS